MLSESDANTWEWFKSISLKYLMTVSGIFLLTLYPHSPVGDNTGH